MVTTADTDITSPMKRQDQQPQRPRGNDNIPRAQGEEKRKGEEDPFQEISQGITDHRESLDQGQVARGEVRESGQGKEQMRVVIEGRKETLTEDRGVKKGDHMTTGEREGGRHLAMT